MSDAVLLPERRPSCACKWWLYIKNQRLTKSDSATIEGRQDHGDAGRHGSEEWPESDLKLKEKLATKTSKLL